MTEYTVAAYAKINWFLQVVSRRENGYHNLRMLMHTIDLADTVTIRREKTPGIRLICDHPGLQSEQNLAYRAALLMIQQSGLIPACTGMTITLTKRIPVSAGLGGGSADAAAVLTGLSKLWELNWDTQRLIPLAVQLGADVPFFLDGGCQLATGIGETLSPLSPPEPYHLLLVKPPYALSTAAVFARYDSFAPASDSRDLETATHALSVHDLSALATSLRNDLFPAANALLPYLTTLRDVMLSCGALGSQISGSGPTVFGLFTGPAEAMAAKSRLQVSLPEAWIAYVHTAVGG